MKSSKQKSPICTVPLSKRHLCNKQKEGTIAGLYDLGETIGKGHYAVVKLAHHVFTGEKVAVKVIDKSKLDENSKAHLFQEVRCMKLVQHENVVKLYQVIDTQTKLYLILEFADGGDLYDYIMKHDKGLNEDQARHYFSQIVNAIDFCHKLHVVHRDLKPENVVFFKSQNAVKLTDFGFSNKFIPGNKLDTSCGSLAYSAPEILLGDSYDAPAVDIWSLGVILYMLVCGEAPFHEANDSETLTMIMDCRYTIPTYVSDVCKDLIGRMLVKEPSDRARLDDIMIHPWLCEEKYKKNELPLICQEVLSTEDHNAIVEKMINGNFATLSEITESLKEEAYDHITATYFLLAEKLLNRRRIGLAEAIAAAEIKPVLSPLALSPRTSNSSCDLAKMIANISTGDFERNHTPFECLVSPPSSHNSPSSSSNILNLSLEEDIAGELQHIQPTFRNRETPPLSLSPSIIPIPLSLSNVSLARPIFTVQSSPQLLNEICEEEESDIEDNNREPYSNTLSNNLTYTRKTSRNRNKNLEQIRRKRMSAVTRGIKNISSSEDVSESEEQKIQNNKPVLLRCRVQGCGKGEYMRRDSSEHSSDTEGTGGFIGNTGILGRIQHIQGQHRTQSGNGDSRSSGQPLYGSRKWCSTSLGNNINETHEDSIKAAEPQINLLKAALKKLNVSFTECERCIDDPRKLSSVTEENVIHSNASLSSPYRPEINFLGRRASSLTNISSLRWNSLKFLDLSYPKLDQRSFIEEMMMMFWDDQEIETVKFSVPYSLRNANLYKSVDENLHGECCNFNPIAKNWRFSLDKTPPDISLFA